MNKIRTSLYVDKDLYVKMKLYCLENDIFIKDFLNEIIKEKLKNYKK